jgi:hypothetical protein
MKRFLPNARIVLRHLLFLVSIAFLVSLGLVITRVWQARAAIQAWEKTYADAEILGRSPDELIVKFGTPGSVFRRKDCSVEELQFDGPSFMICEIRFANGRAVEAKRRMK